MTDQELIALDAKGFVPGPGEDEGAFLERVRRTREGGCEGEVPRGHWEWAREQVRELYGFEPEVVRAWYSNRGLRVWEGAACWIEGGVARLQLREGFRRGRYWWYRRDEVLAHEAVHAARVMFEGENEEFFAYAVAGKRWRRVLGPVVRREWEVWMVMGGLGGGVIWEGAWVGVGVMVGMGLWRLGRQWRRLRRAFEVLRERLGERRARCVLFRLTDEEVRQLAKGVWVEGDKTLRWRLIRIGYMMEGLEVSYG